MQWGEFEKTAPEVAGSARQLIERWGFLIAGTIRRDGTPRMSPVEGHFVAGELMLVMIKGSLKARDLLRDPRIVLNAPVTNAGDPGAELKVRGHVGAVDAEQRRTTAEAVAAASGWRPPDDWHFFSVDVDDVAHILWTDGAMDMTRWSARGGLQRELRPAPVL